MSPTLSLVTLGTGVALATMVPLIASVAVEAPANVSFLVLGDKGPVAAAGYVGVGVYSYGVYVVYCIYW